MVLKLNLFEVTEKAVSKVMRKMKKKKGKGEDFSQDVLLLGEKALLKTFCKTLPIWNQCNYFTMHILA